MQNEQQRLEIIGYIEKASVAILGLLLILFPVFLTNLTTDYFILPKQALVIFVGITVMVLYGIKTLLLEKVQIRRTPFDLAVILFIAAVLLSSVFSAARTDSLTNFIPLLFAGILYFGIVFNAKNEKSVMVLIGSLLTGACLLAIMPILSHFHLYILPYDFTKTANFTPTGSNLDQVLYLLFVLPVSFYFLAPFLLEKQANKIFSEKKEDLVKILGFGLAGLIILAGLAVSIYNLVQPSALIILPLETGFQTAFAAISQDSGRTLQGFLFGNGFGEYLLDFAKFKQASFNTNPTLWGLGFIHSSTFVLELLATTGLLGFLSFLYLCYKVLREKPLFVPVIIVLTTAFVLPLTFVSLILLFFLLAIYAALRGLSNDQKYFDVELELVAFKKGFITFTTGDERRKNYGKILSYSVFGIILILVALLGFLSFDYLSNNVTFAKALTAANQNNGQLTYTDENAAISSFTGKYNDAYFRVFSQTNLALANSLAASVPKGASPSAQTQQTIYTLVQQSINAGRQATTLSPQNPLDWQNLATIYRSLIGFGQNADSFAILAQQQAIQLDPANPQGYITLGGIYYQLGTWDKALAQFQQAAALKPDFPNAYYNIAHTLIQQGDLKGALTQLQTVQSLVKNDPTNLAKVNGEIKQLQAQISQGTPSSTATPTPAPTLPKQTPQVKIPAPQVIVTPTKTPSPTVAPTTEGGLPLATTTPAQ
ncbi:MAG TPA: tetratricopeptide repeat protein [Patescibacteria group bacterium]|nr:tetratricopeptide repeat protein [Patescibacteria group bacterium]